MGLFSGRFGKKHFISSLASRRGLGFAMKDSGKSLVSPVVFTGGQESKALKIGRNIALREADILEYES